ncbi:Enoyl-CoA hydratase [Georgfuchsia toluolica]|uniref:Enoyl-CoA hydratase n=1 Tax=Georgfuchsia toluolica TaxID=424218 RepID=A0A916N8L1_9PROT|nr:enoyl-CoA hydratase/isomerase family protein [Georgfuchsia toluolica]CAG4883392.1 Enoyl-CoA hydratase [Georgfuchsia toluolica]
MIDLTIEGGIAVATLCQPPVNAINDDWVARLDAILSQLEKDPSVSVLWIRSNQRVFCAGANLEFMRARFLTEEGRVLMIAFTRRLQEVLTRLEKIGLVTLAEIGGAALGGGFEMALACDLRIVSDTAKIGLPEARLGLLPAGGGTQRMTRLCGEGVARRLILGAEMVNGLTAVGLGLAQWAAPAAELEAAARTLATRIAELPRQALTECKTCIDAALQPNVNGFEVELAGSKRLLGSTQTQQLVRQFLEKS